MSGSGSGNGDEFGRAVAKIGVAQLCEGLGFTGFQRSAAETLADIAIRYISDLAKGSHFYANLAGRTECNAYDVIMAMEDVGTGPSSATDTNKPLSNSKALQDLMKYVEYSEEIPFCKPLPHFPVVKKRVPAPSFVQAGETPPYGHIPNWLPAFPDPHTYKSTPVWDERKSDPRIDKLESARQRRKAERSLVSLHLRLSSGMATVRGSPALPSSVHNFGGTAVPSTAVVVSRANLGASSSGTGVFPSLSPASRQQWPPDSEQAVLLSRLETESSKGKGKRVTALQNPFLASPFPAGEKEVALITFPGKVTDQTPQIAEAGRNIALPSVMETFASALESARLGLETPDTARGGGLGNAIPDFRDRRPVLMSFDNTRRVRRKALTAQLSIGALRRTPNMDKAKAANPGKEEEKDDRKKRAEQILSRSYLEGVDDLSQP